MIDAEREQGMPLITVIFDIFIHLPHALRVESADLGRRVFGVIGGIHSFLKSVKCQPR